MSAAENVVNLPPPKKETHHYKGHKYSIIFIPATGEWKWIVEYSVKVPFVGEASRKQDAVRAAKKKIESMAGG